MLASIEQQAGERSPGYSLYRGPSERSAEGSAIEDYVVEEQGDRVLKTFHTQGEAIIWAKS